MPVVLYNPADDGEGHGTDAKTRRDVQHTGGDAAWSRWSRLTAVCEMLLYVLLLTAITVLWINYHILKTENDQLQTSNNNQSMGKEQLQTSNVNLTIEKEQLQREKVKLRSRRYQLRKERENFEREREEFLTLGWIYFSSRLYSITTKVKNWTESRQNCRERGADLVIINSKEEQEFVTKLRGSDRAWIGLDDTVTENKWKWVDDTTLITGFWAIGQPDNFHGEENCVGISLYSDLFENWADYPCNSEFPWICEKTIFN